MKKYRDLQTGEIYKVGDTLVRKHEDFSIPGVQAHYETTVFLSEFAANKLVEEGWLEVVKEKTTKTYLNYLTELQNISDKDAVELAPWMIVPVLMKLIKKDFNTPIRNEGWALSNITLDFIPIQVKDVKNPELVTLFAKEDVDKIRTIIKPMIDVFLKKE